MVKRMMKTKKAFKIAMDDLETRGYDTREMMTGHDNNDYHYFNDGYLKLDDKEGDIFYLSGLASPTHGKGMFHLKYEIDTKKKEVLSFEDEEVTFELRRCGTCEDGKGCN